MSEPSPSAKLTGSDVEKLTEILRECYDRGELEMLCRTCLGEQLDDIATADNHRQVCFKLINWTERYGRTGDLLKCLHAQRPQKRAAIEAMLLALGLAVPATPAKPEPTRHKLRWAALAVVAVLAIAALAAFFLLRDQRYCTPGRLCVLIARFDADRDKLAAQLKLEIQDELRRTHTDAQVQVVPFIDDADVADALVEREDAIVLVYGAAGNQPNNLSIYYAVRDRLGISESSTAPPFRVEPITFSPVRYQRECEDCVQLVVGAQVGTAEQQAEVRAAIKGLVSTAVALFHYATLNPEAALTSFNNALVSERTPVNTLEPWTEPPYCKTQTVDKRLAGLYYYAGKAAVQTGAYERGLALLCTASQAQPADPAPWIAIGAAYRTWSDNPANVAATFAFTTAEGLIEALSDPTVQAELALGQPALAAAVYDRGILQQVRGSWASAAAAYAEAAARFGYEPGAPNQTPPRSAYVSLVQWGRALTQVASAGDAEAWATTRAEAQQVLEAATRADPQAPWAWLALAELHRADRAKADEYLAQAEKAAPTEVAIHVTRARLCQEWDDSVCAVDAYQAALAARPSDGLLHVEVGNYYLPASFVTPGAADLPHQGWSQAQKYFEEAVLLRPMDPWVREKLATTQYFQNQAASAVESFQDAVERANPADRPARLLCNVGGAMLAAGDVARAAAKVEECAAAARSDADRARVDQLRAEIAKQSPAENG